MPVRYELKPLYSIGNTGMTKEMWEKKADLYKKYVLGTIDGMDADGPLTRLSPTMKITSDDERNFIETGQRTGPVLTLKKNCDLVLTDRRNMVLWEVKAPSVVATPCTLSFNKHGGLSLKDKEHEVFWGVGTGADTCQGFSPARAEVTQDAQFVIKGPDGQVMWSSNTAGGKKALSNTGMYMGACQTPTDGKFERGTAIRPGGSVVLSKGGIQLMMKDTCEL